jgi:hypothetical protein
MKKLWILKIGFFILIAAVVMSAIVMWLWNWLVPVLFGGPVISFLQAAGLLILSKILFKGFMGGMKGHRCGGWRNRWEKMSPEEREKMRTLWKKRCMGYEQDDEKLAD